MHKSKLRRITLIVCLAMMPLSIPLSAMAAGLGKLTVLSGVGEPLNAEIELVSVTAEDLADLTATIAPDTAYAAQGISRNAIQSDIKIDQAKKADGTAVLKLTTKEAVNDPFVDMLIQVDWPSGRLVREYTVLLDPPDYMKSGKSINAPAISDNAPKKPLNLSIPEELQPTAVIPMGNGPSGVAKTSNKQTALKPRKIKADKAKAPADNDDTYTTKSGDTLTKIANQMQVDGVSLDQMLVGLYQNNRSAFSGNMNQLKVGQSIRMPSQEKIEATSRRDAIHEVHLQTADWKAYRNHLAGTVSKQPDTGNTPLNMVSGTASSQSSKGKITAPAQDKAAPVVTGPQDVIKLSKSDNSTKNSASEVKSMQDRVNALQEEQIARDGVIKDANQRIAALEKQIDDMQKLLEVKNQALANLQKNAAEAAQSKAQPKTEGKPEAQSEQAKSDTAQNPKSESQSQPKPAIPAPAAVRKPGIGAPQPVASTSFIDDFLKNSTMIGAAGVLLLFLVGIWIWLRNKRKRGLDNIEKAILTSGGLKSSTVFGNVSGGKLDGEDTSFLTNFSPNTGGMMDTHEVDPIAEAEVYMAYGREAQAEEILKDAIKREPKRYDLHLKLLEILSARNDSSAFETIAAELYTTLGASSPTWQKVAAMGHEMEPENPLYITKTITIESVQATAIDVNTAVEAPTDNTIAMPIELSEEAVTDHDLESGNLEPDNTTDPLDIDFSDATVTESADALVEDAADSALVGVTSETVEEPITFDFEEDQPIEPAYDLTDNPAHIVEVSREEMELVQDAMTSTAVELAATTPAEEISKSVAEKPVVEELIASPEIPIEDVWPDTVPTIEPTKTSLANLDLPSLELSVPEPKAELPELNDSAPVPAADDSQHSPTTIEAEKTDFEAISIEPARGNHASNNELPDMNLSDISLDFDSEPADIESFKMNDNDASSVEPDDVDTKLDLVTAYMDMGDSEGAKELIEEVLKEGGPKQRERAQKILDSIA